MEQRNGGDDARDIGGADTEIFLDGLAWAQLASAEKWLQQMFGPGGLLATAQTVHFTGYSLGGHIASVMTELHPEWVSSTWVFNGSGRGAIAGGYSIRQLIDAYNRLLADPDAEVPGILNVRPTDAIGLAEYEAAKQEAANPPTAAHSVYLSARHRWALRVIGPYADGIATSTVFSGQSIDPVADAKITYVYGMATHHDDTLVSLSGVLPSHRIRVFIEDQPLYYGPFFVPFTSETDKLSRDFMATHSITLLADSLALMRLFQTVDGQISQEKIETIFAAASNRVANASLDAGSATYEADSLERALDKLRWNLIPGTARDERRDTPFDPNAAGFSNIDFRNIFHTRIDEITRLVSATWFDDLHDPAVGDDVLDRRDRDQRSHLAENRGLRRRQG
ncbi:MAG: hypothetical protein IPK20_09480 [Betaproteobacteria bacterium]|nr:hypothetical protein [Betaproteobacteria bacterium]